MSFWTPSQKQQPLLFGLQSAQFQSDLRWFGHRCLLKVDGGIVFGDNQYFCVLVQHRVDGGTNRNGAIGSANTNGHSVGEMKLALSKRDSIPIRLMKVHLATFKAKQFGVDDAQPRGA